MYKLSELIPAKVGIPRWVAISRYSLISLALLAFCGYFVIYSIYAVALFRFPFDYDQGEGFELMDSVLLSQGQWPYLDISVYPFYSSNYPPIFHVVVAPLIWVFGPEYWTGRLISFAGTVITAATIGYAVHREGRRWWLSTLAGLSFLASNYVYHVGPLFRQHMFMVMLETLAVVLLTVVIEREERSQRGSRKGLLVVMLLLILSGYTKQLAYATAIAVFLFLFLRTPKRALGWAVVLGCSVAAIFFLINLATDGQWLVNTVTANLNPFILDQSIGLFRQWLRLHTVLTLGAAALAIYQLYFDRLSAYSIWFVVTAANSFTSGKWGAGESYFATTIAASCILSGLAFNRVLDWSAQRRGIWHFAVATVIPVLFLWQADKFFHMPTHTPFLRSVARILGKPAAVSVAPQTGCSAPRPAVPVPYVDSAGVSLLGRPPSSQDTAGGIAIVNSILEGETAAFSEEAGFNLYAGRDVVTNPTQLLNLYNGDQVDLTMMLNMLDRQEFDTIIFRAQFYPPPVLDRIGQRYQTTKLVEMNGFVYCIMKPKAA